jgi:hypothetical protein
VTGTILRGKACTAIKLLQFVTESLKLISFEESINKHRASMTINLRIVLSNEGILTPLERLIPLLKDLLDSYWSFGVV